LCKWYATKGAPGYGCVSCGVQLETVSVLKMRL